jgi:prolipoprotein diacylglyceryltransferase
MILAFAAGFLVFRLNTRGVRSKQMEHLLPVVLAAFFGGLAGAKIPIILMNLKYGLSWETLLAGRTIVGGLVGGTLGVFLIKKRLGIRARYGNLLAPPIALGMAVGRLGCLLNGCCFGKPTGLPWGIDFGDGIARHPTQAYELLFCLAAFILLQRKRHTAAPGQLLSGYFLAYFGFRFFVEFLRPHPSVAGLSAFQWICIAGMLILFARIQCANTGEVEG